MPPPLKPPPPPGATEPPPPPLKPPPPPAIAAPPPPPPLAAAATGRRAASAGTLRLAELMLGATIGNTSAIAAAALKTFRLIITGFSISGIRGSTTFEGRTFPDPRTQSCAILESVRGETVAKMNRLCRFRRNAPLRPASPGTRRGRASACLGKARPARKGKQYQPSSGQFAPPMASERLVLSNRPGPHEAVSAQIFHLVERPNVWHAIVDVAVRRAGRPGRAGQPLLSHQGPQDRSDARLRAALGGL